MISLPSRSRCWPLYLVCGSGVCQFFTVGRATHLRRKESAGARRGGLKIPIPLPMGARWGRDQDPTPLRVGARWERGHDLAPIAPAVGPSISSVVPARASFLGPVALPICAGRRARGRDGSGIKIPPLYPCGRDGGEIKIQPPCGRERDESGITISPPSRSRCWSLYLVCGSGACQFFMVGRASHLRGKESAGARRGRAQDPAPYIHGIATGARSRSRPLRLGARWGRGRDLALIALPLLAHLSLLCLRRVQVF